MSDERDPVYWFCNSCGEEVDEHAECCIDGENEPSYDQAEE